LFLLSASHLLSSTVSTSYSTYHFLDTSCRILFFTLMASTTLFWAEIYYISKDQLALYTDYIRPLIHYLIGIMCFGIVICILVITADIIDHVDYFKHFSRIIAISYVIIAGFLTYYIREALSELIIIPIGYAKRKMKILQLRFLGFICITSLLCSSILIFVYGNRQISDFDGVSLLGIYFNFTLLEVLPLSTLQWYYWINNPRYETDPFLPMETQPFTTQPLRYSKNQQSDDENPQRPLSAADDSTPYLLPAPRHEGERWSDFGGWSASGRLIRQYGGGSASGGSEIEAPGEVIEEIIEKLSMSPP